MKLKLLLTAALLATTLAAEARGVGRGSHSTGGSHSRSSYSSSSSARSGYAHRNPYAATPSVRVQGYYRSTGTIVMPHSRTPANNTIIDNLSYRGYGTIRVPRY